MDFGGDAVTGAVLTLAAGGLVAGVKWLVGAKFKQLDGMPGQLGEIKMELALLKSRLGQAEEAIANDKAGRKAFAETREEIAKIGTTVAHHTEAMARVETGIRDLWSRLNRISDAA